MATMETISAALKLTDVKKSDLRKAFEDLQAVSSSLSSFTLNWLDIDHYFTSIQTQLEKRFKQLETQITPSLSRPSVTDPSSSSTPSAKILTAITPPLPRPELKAFCVAMDGEGLRKYLSEHPKERQAIRVEIQGALRCASDPAAMILDAMEGFYPPDSTGDRDPGLSGLRRDCMLLLEELMGVKPEIKPEVNERAKKLAVEWKGKMSTEGENPLEKLGFLHLLATYGLGSEFDMNEILDFFVIIARYRQAVQLCRVLTVTDKIPNLIQKLISEGKQLLAVKFIFEFAMTDKFLPVPLLKAYVTSSKKNAKKVRKDGNNSLQSLNEAAAKEISALRQVIKHIEDHNLESEYPKGNLEKRIVQLEKQKAERKRPAAAAAPKQKQQNGSKRPRMTAPAVPAAVPKSVANVNSTIPPFQQPHPQSAGLLPDHPAPYLTSSAGPYGLVGSAPTAAPYTGSSAGLYGLAGTSMGFPGNLSPTRSHMYASGSHMPSGYYDGAAAYAGYGLPPQYHPSYYPQ